MSMILLSEFFNCFKPVQYFISMIFSRYDFFSCFKSVLVSSLVKLWNFFAQFVEK